MNRVNLIIAIMIMMATTIQAQSPASSTKAYKTGEYMKYSLNYGFITGGYVTFTVDEAYVDGIKTEHINLWGISAGIVEALFRIRDNYVSYVNPETNQPVKSIRDIREGKYKYYNEVTYDYTTLEEDSITIQSKKSGEVRVPKDIQDILSAVYYGRNFYFNDNMQKGDIISFNSYFGDEIFPLKIKFMGVETIKTAQGKVECFLFHPVTEVGRAFKTEEDMKLWITRDKNRIPILAKMNLKVGSFTVELEEYKNLKHPFSSLKN